MSDKTKPSGYAQKAALVAALRKENQQLRRKVKQLEKSKTDLQDKMKQIKLHYTGHCQAAAVALPGSSLIARHQYTELLVSLCIHMYVLGGCSLRGVLRLLDYLNTTLQWGLSELPCKTSVENWLLKAGYHVQQAASACAYPNGYSIVADECMVVGQERLLAALSIPAIKEEDTALQLHQAAVVHLQVKPSWDGDAVKEAIETLSKKMGAPPVYVVSDGCGNLRSGFEKAKVERVADVGHQLALLMEQTYRQDEAFLSFNKAVAQCRLKEVMKPTAYLLPPKQRCVARFMNLSVWVRWAEKLLGIEAALPPVERQAYGFIKEHSGIIAELSTAVAVVEEVGAVLKEQGLSGTTIARCIANCNDYATKAAGNIEGLLNRIKTYLWAEEAKLPDRYSVWHNSSDILESLFGMYKERKACNTLHGVTPFVLLLPLFTKTDRANNTIHLNCKEALQTVRMKNLKQWNTDNLIQNQVVRRRKALHNST